MVGTLKISICTGERLRLSGETDAEHGPLEIEFEIEDDDEEGDTQDDEDGNDGDQTETEAPSQEQPRERQAITRESQSAAQSNPRDCD